MNLKTLDKILNRVLIDWRKGLGRLDPDTLTSLMADGNIADDLIELRDYVVDLQAEDGLDGETTVEHLLHLGSGASRALRGEDSGLDVHPERYYYDGELPPELTTGIIVRALNPDNQWGDYDIGQLTLDSLMKWLRASGEKSPLAENTLAIVLGHDLRADDNRKGKNGRGPLGRSVCRLPSSSRRM
jgi:hypothetical protein